MTSARSGPHQNGRGSSDRSSDQPNPKPRLVPSSLPPAMKASIERTQAERDPRNVEERERAKEDQYRSLGHMTGAGYADGPLARASTRPDRT